MEKNHGVLQGQRLTDYVGGTLPYEIRVADGNWKPYLPPGEWQRNHYFDTYGCVSFSALNSIEVQMKLIGIERNFSDRFTVIMSGTIPNQGNWLFKVADSIRKDGLVDEAVFPAPAEYTQATYFAPPSIEVINKAREFLTEYDVKYEFIPCTKEQLKYHLKHAPIQIVIYDGSHAVLDILSEVDIEHYFDSYDPFLKQYNTLPSSACKIVVNKKNKVMSETEVKKQYALSFYREPSAEELAYWIGKDLLTFLNTALKDRSAFLNQQSQ